MFADEIRRSSLDTGMTELMRPRPLRRVHPMFCPHFQNGFPPIDSDLSDFHPGARVDGPVCESTDTLGSTALPPLERGDLVAIGMAGAYGSSMASTYNGRPRPPEIAWDGNRLTVLRRRGSVHSLP